MKIIRTHEADLDTLPPWERDQVYNGLDICVTHDVFAALNEQFDEYTARTYSLSQALQGPVLEMRLRGCLVDQVKKMEVIEDFTNQIEVVEKDLEKLVYDGVGMDEFNWRSPKSLQNLFYNYLALPIVRKRGAPTCDRQAREHLASYPIATQLVKHINFLTELGDKISVLRTGIDPDGRIRTSYNIAGTNTGRFSSSLSEFGTGGNLQNIEESLRSIFIADKGYKFAKFDAKSGESFCVGALEWNLFKDDRYLEVCESGDPHTAVARLMWPNLGWTGNLKRDKSIAETPYYRHYTYRFMCKKLGHGSNYGGMPDTLSEQSRVPIKLVAEFQPKYFAAFPHKLWHKHVDNELRTKGYLISLMGRKRYFFGKRTDPEVYREALAYDPQSSLSDIVNTAMLNCWRKNIAIVMFQDHDAITFMYPEEAEDEIIPRLFEALKVPVQLAHGRTLLIPYDCEVGWNKGKYNENKNQNGLMGYAGHDKRKRAPEADLMDAIVHRTNRKPRFTSNLA